MYKKKSFFIVFEGIEGSGKSYQARKLYKNLRRNKVQTIITREPGGTEAAEKIRELILNEDAWELVSFESEYKAPISFMQTISAN